MAHYGQDKLTHVLLIFLIENHAVGTLVNKQLLIKQKTVENIFGSNDYKRKESLFYVHVSAFY